MAKPSCRIPSPSPSSVAGTYSHPRSQVLNLILSPSPSSVAGTFEDGEAEVFHPRSQVRTPMLGHRYAGRGVRQGMAMQSGFVASAPSLARAYAIGGSTGGEAGRSDSLTLTPPLLLPSLCDGETGAIASLFGCRRLPLRLRGPPQRLPNNCQNRLLTSSLVSASGGPTAGGLPCGVPRSQWAPGSPLWAARRRPSQRGFSAPPRPVRSSLPTGPPPPLRCRRPCLRGWTLGTCAQC